MVISKRHFSGGQKEVLWKHLSVYFSHFKGNLIKINNYSEHISTKLHNIIKNN